MDIKDLEKLANRKRLLDEIGKVGGKVSKANAKLIKLQVAHDTAFWELKEKVGQKESENETLQQNMVTLQMEYETLSTKNQEELQRRPEVLNKIAANQTMSKVLQGHRERVMESIVKIEAVKAVLCDAYMKADNVVRDLKETHIKEMEKAKHKIELLERTITMSNEHQAQLAEAFSACKQKADEDLNELKNKLEEKDERISTLQRDIKEMTNIQNAQLAEMREAMVNKETELKSYDDETELLKGALANKESLAKEARDQNSSSKERMAELKEKYQRKVISSHENDLKKLKEHVTAKIKQIKELSEGFNNALKESRKKSEHVKLLAKKQEILKQISAVKNVALQYYRVASEVESKKREATIEKIDKKIDAIDGILSMTTMNLQKGIEHRKSLEKELKNAKRERELEMSSSAERQTALNTQLAQLEPTIKPQEINRRFDALFRSQPLPAVPPAMIERRREDRHFASLATPQPQPLRSEPRLQPQRSQPQPQLQPQSQLIN